MCHTVRSLSYVLVLASMAYLLMAAFYAVIDSYQLWTGAPFTYLGLYCICTHARLTCTQLLNSYARFCQLGLKMAVHKSLTSMKKGRFVAK